MALSLAFPAVGCAGPKLGGMTIHQAFPDDRVAKMIRATVDEEFDEAEKQIKAGADVNFIGTDEISPLIWVMFEARRSNDLDGLEYLLKAGANPNYRAKQMLHESAMSIAAGGDHLRILELLLKNKGDPNLLGPGDDPILSIAVFERRRRNVEMLLKYGADINAPKRDGENIASQAAGLAEFELVAFLLEQGLTYNLQDLAKDVEIRQVPPNSDARRWQNKVIEMLKARGVKFPAFVPNKRHFK